MAPGRMGVGQTQETLFRVPEGAIGYWTHRFLAHGALPVALIHRLMTAGKH